MVARGRRWSRGESGLRGPGLPLMCWSACVERMGNDSSRVSAEQIRAFMTGPASRVSGAPSCTSRQTPAASCVRHSSAGSAAMVDGEDRLVERRGGRCLSHEPRPTCPAPGRPGIPGRPLGWVAASPLARWVDGWLVSGRVPVRCGRLYGRRPGVRWVRRDRWPVKIHDPGPRAGIASGGSVSAPVAQGIEHRSPKAGVGSSNLPRRTVYAGQRDVDVASEDRQAPLKVERCSPDVSLTLERLPTSARCRGADLSHSSHRSHPLRASGDALGRGRATTVFAQVSALRRPDEDIELIMPGPCRVRAACGALKVVSGRTLSATGRRCCPGLKGRVGGVAQLPIPTQAVRGHEKVPAGGQ